MLWLNRFCLASTLGAALFAGSVIAQPPSEGDRGEGDRPGRGRGAEDGRRGGPPDGEGRGRPGGPGGFRGGPGGPGGFRGGPGGPGGPSPQNMMRMMPVLAALDADGDGKISKAEINNATAALKKLDKNDDGELTAEEMRPNFAAMRGGPGGPGAAGRRGRPPLEERAQDASPERGRGPGRPDGERGPGRPDGVGDMVARMMQMDKNDDGKLDKDELPERMQNMITRADKNEDGFLSRDELQAVAAAMGAGRSQPDPSQFAGRMFADRDANDDGKLSGDELPEQMASRLELIDTDGDGSVSRKEFDTMLRTRMRGGQGRPGAGPRDGDRGGEPGGQRPRRPDAEKPDAEN